jgi:hypothetical protein
MKVEIKNWLGVVVLLCLGFIVGRMTILPDVKAEPQEASVGRYQLVIGEYKIPCVSMREDGTTGKGGVNTIKTLFRMDTVTGDIDHLVGMGIKDFPDGTQIQEHKWASITSDVSTKTK